MCRATHHLQSPATVQTLPMLDVNGAPVIGIVCDNLCDMPDSLRNRLILPLPEALRNVPLTWSLENAHKGNHKSFPPKALRRANAKPTDNAGTVRQERDSLIYTPPDEFNSNPEPQRLSDIQHGQRRIVVLTVRRDGPNTEGSIVAQQSIILARPPLVAIHGINTSLESPTWKSKDRLVSRLKDLGTPIVWVEHGRKDFNFRNPLATPALEFYGNGPVEEGAQQVAAAITQTLRTFRQTEHLAIRRVDLLGYSYGGVIARWYLHQFRPDIHTHDSFRWYVRSANTDATHPLYRLDSAWYAAQGNQQEEEKRRRGEEEKENNKPVTLNSGVRQASEGGADRMEGRAQFSDQELSTRNPGVPPEGRTQPATSLPPVRKLITVASMWRGVPLCNYVNEIHAPDTGGIRLRDAPLLGHKIGLLVDDLAAILPTRVPAMEVMAVNSPWLTTLNNFVEGDQRKPFLETVAYGCVAGDENAFLTLPGSGTRLDPYSVLRLAQVPSWFPYIALERHPDSDHNYSDGLVPLWSAVISDNFDCFHPSRIVSANHDSILTSKQTLEYVVCALNHRAWLPNGRLLNARWGNAIASRDLAPTPEATRPQNGPIPDFTLEPSQPSSLTPLLSSASRRQWAFQPGEMAPPLQNQLYPQIGFLGRIAPDALREIRQVRIEQITQDSVTLSWHTAAELNGYIAVTHWEPVNFGAYDYVEVNCLVKSLGPRVTRDHHFRISNLQPNTTYQMIATSEAYNPPDDVVSVRSDPIRFTTKF